MARQVTYGNAFGPSEEMLKAIAAQKAGQAAQSGPGTFQGTGGARITVGGPQNPNVTQGGAERLPMGQEFRRPNGQLVADTRLNSPTGGVFGGKDALFSGSFVAPGTQQRAASQQDVVRAIAAGDEVRNKRLKVTLPDGSVVAVNPQDGSLIADARQVAGEAAVGRAGDPTQQRFGAQALNAIGNIDPRALQGIASRVGGLEGLLAAQQAAGRTQAEGARSGQAGAIEQLAALASGQNSIVDAQTKLAQDRLARSIGGQLASQRGGFNPAAQRQAFRALSQGQVDLGATAAAAKAEEQQNAIKNLFAATSGLRGQDLSALGLEGTLAGQRAGLLGQQGGLLDATNRSLSDYAQFILGRGDRAAQERLQAAGIAAGVPVQQEQGKNFFGSTLGGAGAGAAIGSFGGPVGSAIGAGIGGLTGLLGGIFG